MSDLDRIETTFRLSLVGQREQSTVLKEVASSLRDLAAKIDIVSEKSDRTAERLEDSIGVMKSFAEGQAELRRTLAE